MPVLTLGPHPRLPPLPPRQAWRRRGQLGAVLLVVLAAHAWLIGPLQEPLGHAPAQVPAIQLVTLPLPAAAPAPSEDAAGPAPAPTPTPAEPPPLLAAPAPEPAPPENAPAEPPSIRQPPDRPIDWTAGPLAPEAVSGTEPTPADVAATATSAPTRGSVASAQAAAEGGRPPVYTTQLPSQPFKLDYRVERGDEGGIGRFSFELSGEGNTRYRAQLYGVVAEKALMDWVSRGGFDAAGIAPQRMAERQRGVEVRAVNFQRDAGVISFSSSTRALALYDGAQDRVSLLLQLMAIGQAEPGGLRTGQRLRLQVANARGQAAEWRFEVVGDEQIEPAGQPIATVHLVREPSQPYDQRVEVWLAREAGHLPVGLRFTQVPGRGASEAFWLATPLPAAGARGAP